MICYARQRVVFLCRIAYEASEAVYRASLSGHLAACEHAATYIELQIRNSCYGMVRWSQGERWRTRLPAVKG